MEPLEPLRSPKSSEGEEPRGPSDRLWRVIAQAGGSREGLRAILMRMTAEEVVRFEEEFLDAAAELTGPPWTRYTCFSESEDGHDDVTYLVVSRGEDYYEEILAHPERIPHHVEVGDRSTFFGVAGEVHYERFGGPIG